MPIKPENKKLYPKNWKEIRKQILLRAQNKCEFCGVQNHSVGFRDIDGKFYERHQISDLKLLTDFMNKKPFKIVLTIAHLDHDPTNNDPSNLRALCQKCHNNYDKEHRKETRQKTKYKLLAKDGNNE